VDYKQHIVFLHQIQEGPASQSYGLHVAALAGVPASVIRSARKILTKLEQEASNRNPQKSLFDDIEKNNNPPPPHPLLTYCRQLNPDHLSPKEALEQLYQIKSILDRKE